LFHPISHLGSGHLIQLAGCQPEYLVHIPSPGFLARLPYPLNSPHHHVGGGSAGYALIISLAGAMWIAVAVGRALVGQL
jgi:hypothetical protein